MEQEQQPDPLYELTYNRIVGQPLTYWHDFMSCDHDGNFQPDLPVEGSRYGRTNEEVAWFALAAQWIIDCVKGPRDNPVEAMEAAMVSAVNDDPDLYWVIVEHWDVMPSAIQLKIVKRMGQLGETQL